VGRALPVNPGPNALFVGVIDPITAYGTDCDTILNRISGETVVEESSSSSVSVSQGGSLSSSSFSHSSSRGAIAAWTVR
jgi:hypothetical protein